MRYKRQKAKAGLWLSALLVLVMSALQACVTPLNYLWTNTELQTSSAYIAGRFLEDGRLFQFFPKLQVVIKSSDTDQKYGFKFTFNKEIQMLAMPPGNYYVDNIYFADSYTTGSGKNQTTHTVKVNIKIPPELLYPFEVKTGEVFYLGDLHIKKKGFIFVKFLMEYTRELKAAVSDIQQKFTIKQTGIKVRTFKKAAD